ncbi:hypothetical protein SOASR030_00770 [Leminorella grimontii]|uniref:Autotransporter domain-containing protein n=1 Tax=Leminorella grimontii TaxID=82981 RepID=A0AAV5MWC0_9GAMM|nr:autotransporter outer membrane beta-barrel domain-containing protein [Leminorella grimontii]KFC95466.1 autotransporter [Leminorella grimontii ATCC 33999 = DSM 5078]GKX53965.1 hypothetical protein SOASR030_00770 [Leminorella grimontii]VFS60453.1 Outer membrane protein IcsA autotransporter precursor [Leminorella grimontii]
MNKNYSIVWNAARNMYVVASELACGDSRVQNRVRTVGAAIGLILSGLGCANANEVGPQSGASIALQNGDTVTATTGGTGINSSTTGGSGLQIDGKAVISISGDVGSIGVKLDNSDANSLGDKTEIHITDTGTTTNSSSIGLDIEKNNAGTRVNADGLVVDVSAKQSAYGIYSGGSSDVISLGEGSSITAKSSNNIARGVYLNDNKGSFSIDDGFIRAESATAQATGLSAEYSKYVDISLGENTRIEAESGTGSSTGVAVGTNGKLTGNGIEVSVKGAGTTYGVTVDASSAVDFGEGSSIDIQGNTNSSSGVYLSGKSASFVANGINITMNTTRTGTTSITGKGVDVYGDGASVDLGSGSTISMHGYYNGGGVTLANRTTPVSFKANQLTVDVDGDWVYGVKVDGGNVDLGSGSSISATGVAESIWVTSGSLKADALTVKTSQATGVLAQGGTITIGAGSLIDGRNVGASGKTNGICAGYKGYGSGTVVVNFNGTEQNRNTIYAVNGYGASSQFNGQTLNISNTDIIMSGSKRSYGLWAIGNYSFTQAGIINAKNVMLDMTSLGANGYGVVVQQGGIVNLSGDTTIKTDGGVAVWNPLVSSSSDPSLVYQGGTITGTGKMDITGDIINSGWGTIDLTMDADSRFEGKTSVNAQLADNSTLNLAMAEGSQWAMTNVSSLSRLDNAGKVIFAYDSDAGAYSTLKAGKLTLASSSELDVDLGAASLGSDAGTPLIAGNDIALDGVLHLSNVSDAFGLSALTSDADLPQMQVTLIDADSAITGNFSSLSTDPMTVPDYLAFSGRISEADDTQYLLGGGLSWYVEPSSTMAVTPAHGNFTLGEGKSFEVTTALVDVAPEAATGWDGKSLTKKGDGKLILSADNAYSGTTDVQGGTLWLTETGVIGATGSQQAVNVAPAGTLGGSGVVNGNVDNRGLISFDTLLTVNGNVANAGNIASSNTAPGGKLLINGDYAGSGGTLTLNTQLGDDGSLTDRLVVNGNTSGTTTLMVNNVGGQGADTNNGIEVVSVAGRSDGDFTQGNRLQIGLYEYRLYKDGGNWYLRTLSDDPTPDPDVNPQYRPDIGAFIGNQAMMKNLQMQTLYDREGSQLRSEDGAVWMRFKAGQADSTVANGEVDIDNHYSQVQLGSDIAAWGNGAQSLNVGVMGSYVKADTDSDGNRGADGSRFSASGDAHGYNLGVYATWFADAQTHRGLYVDSWYQYGIYDNAVDNHDLGSVSYDSTANAVSLETGYRHDVVISEGRTLSLIPQAQIVWQNYRADAVDFNDVRVDGQNGDSWTSRLGLRVAGKLNKDQNVVQPFLEANWLHGTDDVSVSFDGASVKQDLPADRAELKAGVQTSLGERWSVAAQAVGQKGSHGYGDASFSLNARYSW